MPKLDFSSLKTADLRAVAPINEGLRPAVAAQVPNSVSISNTLSVSPVSVPAIEAGQGIISSPVSVPVPIQSMAPTPTVTAHSIVQPRPVKSAMNHGKKISLTNLKNGGPSFVSPVSVPAIEAGQGISSPVSVPVPIQSMAPTPSPLSTVAALSDSVSEDVQKPKFVPGVDILAPAKVLGTEEESKANKILAQALENPEEAKKRAFDEAAEAVIIPDAPKEFFPNLEMEDDFFKDPMFDGIVPQKEEKPSESIIVGEISDKTVQQETSLEALPEQEALIEVVWAEVVWAEVAEILVPSSSNESAILPEDPVVWVPLDEKPISEDHPAVMERDSAYVESVAKELSESRKGGLAKLFGERKILVRSLGGLVAVAALSIGTFAIVSPSIKTSAPESIPTDMAMPVPIQNPEPAAQNPEPAANLDDAAPFTRVHSVRRPNRKTIAPSSEILPETSGSGVSMQPPEQASGQIAPIEMGIPSKTPFQNAP